MADTNVEKLKAAYRAWHESKAGSGAVWLDLMSGDGVTGVATIRRSLPANASSSDCRQPNSGSPCRTK